MAENEIREFVTNTINQIKSGLPKDCMLNHEIHFDISLITTKQKEGKIGIHIAGVGGSTNTQQVHRIKFSIIDKKSRAENMQQLREAMHVLMQEFKELEQLEEENSGKKK